METLSVLRDLAIIVVFAKFFGIVARKLKAPQVVGEIVAGLIIGPSILGLVEQSDFIIQMAEIGVILLMFSAGLGTDLRELLKTGPIAFL
ncbi:MAG: cation:proton antiporter, partial [Lachnospiraceae bacterium]|nr:cation:proton antiporter [Lachnospiraceae bacterium]